MLTRMQALPIKMDEAASGLHLPTNFNAKSMLSLRLASTLPVSRSLHSLKQDTC